MVTATRVVDERMAMATKRAMVMKTRETGKEEGNVKGSKSNGNDEEEGDGMEDGNGIFSSFV
jgi:hypothetical protein